MKLNKRFGLLAFTILLTGVSYPALAQERLPNIDETRAAASKAMKDLLPQDKSNKVFLDALISTYENNPTLKAARAETRAVFERLPQAEAGWRPTVTANASVNAESSSSDPGSDQNFVSKIASLNLDQPLYRGGRTIAETEAAKNIIRAQLAALEGTEQQVLLQAVTSYLDVMRDEALLNLAGNNQKVIAKQYDATKKRFEVGELTRTDVAQAEARLAKADSEVIAAQANLRSSRASFEKMIGYPPEKLGFPITELALPETLDSAVTFAEQWNPQVRAAQHIYNSSQNNVASQYSGLLPQVSLSGDVTKAYDPSETIDESDGVEFGVVASIPLYEAGSTRSRIRESKKTVIQREQQIHEAKRLAREQTISAWESLQAAHAEMDSRLAQVEAAEVARFGVRQEADLGARTVLDTLDADQEVLDAQVALVSASRNSVVALFTVASALGILSPKTLGFGDRVPDYNREIEAVRTNWFGTGVDSQ